MKSLVLKDLYNIGHNGRTMLLMLIVLAVFFIPFSNTETYIITSGILCSMMVMTTFSFDDQSKWLKYALVMPITRKDIVISKFIVLLVFSMIGACSGLVIGLLGGVVTQKIEIGDYIRIISLTCVSFVSFLIAVVIGSMSIPLLFKFGTEKARILSLVCTIIPTVICYGTYQILILLGVQMTDKLIFILLCGSPIIVLLWCFIMYKISYMILLKTEPVN